MGIKRRICGMAGVVIGALIAVATIVIVRVRANWQEHRYAEGLRRRIEELSRRD